jgi:hypothetical protein
LFCVLISFWTAIAQSIRNSTKIAYAAPAWQHRVSPPVGKIMTVSHDRPHFITDKKARRRIGRRAIAGELALRIVADGTTSAPKKKPGYPSGITGL